MHLSIDPSVGGILEPTKLRHLILSQRRKQPFPDLNVVLNRIVTEDAKLETLALGVEFATTGAMKDALESSPRLASLTRMRISYDGSAEAVEGSADAGLAALCSARGVEIEERFLSQDEMREREQWDWYKKPFGEFLFIYYNSLGTRVSEVVLSLQRSCDLTTFGPRASLSPPSPITLKP